MKGKKSEKVVEGEGHMLVVTAAEVNGKHGRHTIGSVHQHNEQDLFQCYCRQGERDRMLMKMSLISLPGAWPHEVRRHGRLPH